MTTGQTLVLFMRSLLRLFFYLLYHPFASAYDFVAAIVSLGRWKEWVLTVLPFLRGARVLEIGHGPGHLQRVLLSRGLFTVGLDESAQMGRLAKRRLCESASLTRGMAQLLPFPNESFNTVVATFPAEYIFDPRTLNEAQRVLVRGGRFVILPGAVITGHGGLERFMAWLFRISGQTPPNLYEIIRERSREPFANAGFEVETHAISIKSSLLLIVVGTKR